jgi:hypothetical protein
MPVHVDEITSEVNVEAEPLPSQTLPTMPWQEVDRLRQAQSCLRRDSARTRAEGFDD